MLVRSLIAGKGQHNLPELAGLWASTHIQKNTPKTSLDEVWAWQPFASGHRRVALCVAAQTTACSSRTLLISHSNEITLHQTRMRLRMISSTQKIQRRGLNSRIASGLSQFDKWRSYEKDGGFVDRS